MVRKAARSSFGITAVASWQKVEVFGAAAAEEGAMTVVLTEKDAGRCALPAAGPERPVHVFAEPRPQSQREPADEDEPLDSDRQVDGGEDERQRVGPLSDDRDCPGIAPSIGLRQGLSSQRGRRKAH